MKFLKGLALGLLGFLLFLSLSIFGLALMLNYTILSPDFVVSEIDKLDVSTLAEELLSEQIPQGEPYIAEILSGTIADLEAKGWLKEQIDTVVYSSYDYLLGESETLGPVIISLEPVKESLKENLRQAILESLPPELAGLSQAEIEQYFNELYQGISEQIPANLEFTEGLLPPDALATLEQAREYVSYFQLGYKALIGFILLLILGIIFIHRQVKGATRGIGITFLTFGAPGYIGILVAKRLAPAQLSQLDIPAQFQGWLPQLLNDFLAPLEMFCLGLLVGGVVLIVVSFVYKPRQPAL